MRPLVTLHHSVGLVMLLYAAGVLITPHGGAMGWLQANTPITAPMLAALFAGCGTYILIGKPKPPLFSVLTTPILLYSLASLGFLLSPSGGALTAYIAHSGVWFITNASIAERARNRWIS
jgi:hypothetical protein